MPLSPPSITEDEMAIALRGFLLGVVPAGVEVFQGQSNRVPEPTGANFVMFTPRRRARLATNVVTWPYDDPAPLELDHTQSTEVTIQLDCHGPLGGDIAQTIATLWRDDYACAALETADIQPLYANEPKQLPFINGENQYENRWVVEIALQATPIVSTPQEFAATLTPIIEPPLGGQPA